MNSGDNDVLDGIKNIKIENSFNNLQAFFI